MKNSKLSRVTTCFVFTMLLITSGGRYAYALESVSSKSEKFFGFNLDGAVINPKCINLLTSWISDGGIILSALDLDRCQKSNLAFEGQSYEVSSNGIVFYYEDENDLRSRFSYEVIGRTKSGVFALYHENQIGLYVIEEKKTVTDFISGDYVAYRQLRKLSESMVLCYYSATVSENELIVVTTAYDPSAPSSNQCGEVRKSTRINIEKNSY